MSEEILSFELDDGVALIRFNNVARRNAMSADLAAAYDDALVRAAKTPTVRALVITGNGSAFCSGGDIDRLSSVAESGRRRSDRPSPLEPSDIFNVLPDVPPELRSRYTFTMALPFPVVAAVNGPALGAGFVVALHSDVRFASSTAFFATGFAKIGAAPEMGMSWTLPRLVGEGVAREMMLSGRRVPADEALSLGLVSRIYPPEDLLAQTIAYARELAASISPRSVQVIKRQLLRGPGQSFAEAFFESAEDARKTNASADFKEGLAAFKERRAPQFTQRDGH